MQDDIIAQQSEIGLQYAVIAYLLDGLEKSVDFTHAGCHIVHDCVHFGTVAG